MGKFVPPIKNVSKEQLEAVYANVYLDLDRYLARKLLWRGMHELTVEKLHTQLTEGAVLDVGCGIGRFAFDCEIQGCFCVAYGCPVLVHVP